VRPWRSPLIPPIETVLRLLGTVIAALCFVGAVEAQNPNVRITTNSLPDAVVGTLYSFTLTATGGTQPYVWSASGLPAGLSIDSRTGTITGIPVLAERKHDVTLTVQAGARSDQKVLSIDINPAPLSIVTVSPLPSAIVGVPYSQTLTASGGATPYTWSVATGSSPPAGLTLTSGGVLSGSPTTTGTSAFTVQVRDSGSQTATKAFTMTVTPAALTITTSAFPIATLNTPYSAQLQATGGTPPYTWSVATGSLSAGLALASTGSVTGTPSNVGSQDFVIKVTDSSSASATRSFSLLVQAVGGGSFPTISANLPATGTPTQQIPVSLFLSAAFPNTIPVQLNMTFSSNAANPADDPMTQFSNGSRTVSFTIPASTTSFPLPVSLFLGTVSGTVRLTANIQSGPSDIPIGSLTIPPSGPQITNLSVSRPNGGLDLQITGYSTMRRVVTVEFGFDLRTTNGIQHFTLRRSVESDFTTWYRGAASAPFGSAFLYLQSFRVQPNVSIDSVTVTLINEQGGTPTSPMPITN
jgi:hypothetical protein